jgi:hypothetical protein
VRVGAIARFECVISFFTQQQVPVGRHHAAQFVDHGLNLWFRNMLQDGKDEAEDERRIVGWKMRQTLDPPKLD